MKFIGMWCALGALNDVIIKQYEEDKCICAECWLGFKTLYRACAKVENKTTMKRVARAMRLGKIHFGED